MIYAIRLYEIETGNIPVFTALFAEGGDWYKLSSKLDGHIHTDLLHRATFPLAFLSIEFWISEQCHDRAQKSPELREFTCSLQHVRATQWSLGVFSFPRRVEKTRAEQFPLVGANSSDERNTL